MLTDLYQITMAQAYFLAGEDKKMTSFSVTFRENPFKGGYTIAAGIEPALEFIKNLSFSSDDIKYLAGLNAADGTAIFKPEFLKHLSDFKFTGTVECVDEGSLVFPREPIFKVTAPLIEAQLVETTVLNLINFASLVATKSMRCVLAAKGDQILEFGLRRAQGPDGGCTAARASYIGGAHATSNVLAGKLYNIPVAGTHAHSFVMAYSDELEAFRAWAKTSANNVVLLVDTYDTIEGIKNAIVVGLEMKARGESFAGIRIDSGDLAWFAKEARRMLDEAGLEKARIFASNELDEYTIKSLKDQSAPIDVWGVGTKLATAYDQPAMGGVYKLSAVQDDSGNWIPKMKISEQIYKMTIPGFHQVRRFFREDGSISGDMIFDPSIHEPKGESRMFDPLDQTRCKRFEEGLHFEDILITQIKDGERVTKVSTIHESRARALSSITQLHESQLRFLNPHSYPVGVEEHLNDVRLELIKELRAQD